jgi:hypothetical protein
VLLPDPKLLAVAGEHFCNPICGGVGDDPAALPRPVREGGLREWTVSTRPNKAGVGDPALIEPVA